MYSTTAFPFRYPEVHATVFFSHYVLPPFGSMDNSHFRNADHGVTDTRIVLLSAKYRQLRFFNAIF